MTTCAECLSTLRTTRLAEIIPGSAVAVHCASCSNCARVAEEIHYAESRLAATLNEQRPRVDPAELTAAALRGSERHRRARIGRWLRVALVVAGCGVFAVLMERMERRREMIPLSIDKDAGIPGAIVDGNGIATGTIMLKCITPEQATALATPYLRSKAGIYPVPGIQAITVRGKREEFERARAAIDEFDRACQLPKATVVEPPSTYRAK